MKKEKRYYQIRIDYFWLSILAAVPDRAYALFTEKELEKIYNDRNEFYKKLMQMIDTY